MTDRQWTRRAACRDEDPDLWFLEENAAHAKRICRRCPVRTECLAYALSHGIHDGTWGGLTETERHTLITAAQGRHLE